MNQKESDDVLLIQDNQKQLLYNEIRDVQIELKKYFSQKNFELFLINKESKIADKEIKNFKIELKKYYIQQFFIQISIQKINPRFLYNIDPELASDKEKIFKFNDIITNSISLRDFIHISTKIPTNDYFQISLWTFSVIPSYFNFFLSEDDESYFLFFLEKLKEDNKKYFNLYSSIIYYHPLFLSFCKVVFDPVFELILHDDKDQYDPPSKLLQNLEKTIHLCPSIVTKVLQMIPESDLMDHVHQHFYEQLVLFPHRFFVLPEYYVLPHRTIQILKVALENFVDELIHNQNPLSLHFQDKNNLIFASFDLELIKYKINISRRRISNGPTARQRPDLNQDQNLNLGGNLNRARRSNNQNPNQNTAPIPSFQQQKLNQNQEKVHTTNQNHESIPTLNQNQASISAQNQESIPSLKVNQNKESIPTQNQNKESVPSFNQSSIPTLSQNQTSRRLSLTQNKNESQSQYPNTKATRRMSQAPNKNQSHNPEIRPMLNTPQTSNLNNDQISIQKNDNINSNKSNRENLPQSNFTTGGVSNLNRKRSVSAATKAKSDLSDNTNVTKSNGNYKYYLIEVSKGQERYDVSEVIDFEKCLNDSFFSSSEEIFPLSASLSSSLSSFFLSDISTLQGTTSLAREEISTFFHNFRKLLQNSDTLPILDFSHGNDKKNCVNNADHFDIVSTLYDFLVSKGGSFSTLIARAACFESIRQYLNQISGNDLWRMITSYKKMARSMKKLCDEKETFISYRKKTKILFEKTFIFYKLIFRLGDTFLYDESRRKSSKQIVDDPFSFFMLYEQCKSIDPVIAKLQYHAFIHNLRFIDFCQSHPELKKYDDLLYYYMESNKEYVIHSQPKSAKFIDKLNLIRDRFMFEPIVKSIQHAFDINAVPYEKFEIISKCFENVECWLRSVMDYGGDDMLPFTIFIFALANPKKFVSNTVFMYLFLLSSIWKIDQNECPVILTRLKSFITIVFNSFSNLSSLLPLKVFKVDILYILDYSKLVNNENNQDNANNNNNNFTFRRSNFISLIDSIDEDKIREPGKPFRTIYQDESPIIGELIFHDCSQNFSLNANININNNVNTNTNQNSSENDNSNVITSLLSNVIGQKKSQYDVLVIESDKPDFVRKAINKNKNVQKKIVFCNRNASDEMKNIDIQCFKIMPRFSLCRALKEIFNLIVKIE